MSKLFIQTLFVRLEPQFRDTIDILLTLNQLSTFIIRVVQPHGAWPLK